MNQTTKSSRKVFLPFELCRALYTDHFGKKITKDGSGFVAKLVLFEKFKKTPLNYISEMGPVRFGSVRFGSV